jgi:chaperonin GroEL (HSP60 family)
MEAISRNAGLDARAIVARGAHEAPDRTFDAWKGVWVDPWESGILDSVAVLVAALEGGVSAAASALTSEVLIHRPDQEPSFRA